MIEMLSPSAPKLTRFGKPSADIAQFKRVFVTQNDALLKRQREWASLYTAQPRRERCMACAAPIGAPDFFKVGIPFSVCQSCGHLNGHHQDTDAYCAALYTSDEGTDYAKVYSSGDRAEYRERVGKIYSPKAEFLFDGLRAEGVDPLSVEYADFGAGSGYFLAALSHAGAKDITGYEVSGAQIELARAMLPGVSINRHDLSDIVELSRTCAATVVTMIGVLEHLQRPRDVLSALRDNPSVRYLYISVPLFGPSVFIELAFPQVMQRHLSGAHTHLFTDASLSHIAREFDMVRVAEWWFGTDIPDLMRCLNVTLPDGARERASGVLAPMIDALQLVIDERKASSEVHILARFDRP
jgi:hypothetical protein